MTHDIAVNGLFIWVFIILVFNALAFIGNGLGLVFGFAAGVMAWLGFKADPVTMGLLLAGATLGPALIVGTIAWLKLDKLHKEDEAIDRASWEQEKRIRVAALFSV